MADIAAAFGDISLQDTSKSTLHSDDGSENFVVATGALPKATPLKQQQKIRMRAVAKKQMATAKRQLIKEEAPMQFGCSRAGRSSAVNPSEAAHGSLVKQGKAGAGGKPLHWKSKDQMRHAAAGKRQLVSHLSDSDYDPFDEGEQANN